MRNRFFHYLHFTRKERNGTIALLLICALIFATPEILSRFRTPEGTDFSGFRKEIQTFRDSLNSRKNNHSSELFYFDPNTAGQEDFVRLGLSEKTAAMICKYRDKGGQFRRAEDFKKIWGLAADDYERLAPYIRMGNEERDFPEKQFAGRHSSETFQFDPNTATEDDFQRLGLPKWTIKSILNYRSKGGKFRRKEDFQKIYNLPEEDYARLESFITIPPSAGFAQAVSYSATSKFPSRQPANRSIDINRADAEAWMALPGIGEKRARQLVNYREKLGGFLSVEQVAQMYNLPDSVFQSIRPWLVLESREIRKIDLNSASAADLASHPYFSKKQADLIVNYRQQHGPYRSVDDIDRIIPFTDKVWLAKVKAYLRV